MDASDTRPRIEELQLAGYRRMTSAQMGYQVDDSFVIAARLASALDGLRVPYAVGGSLASSLHGVPRATNDVGIVADLRAAHVDRFVSAIEEHFYVDAEMVRGAVADLRRSRISRRRPKMRRRLDGLDNP